MSDSSGRPPPFLQALLKSNQSPLDSQIPAIRDLIATTEAQLAALSLEREGFRRKDEEFLQLLAPLEKQISEIQKKRRTLQKKASDLDATMCVVETQIQAQNSILSPIRRLAPELLCEIFLWAMLHGFTRRILRWKVSIAPWRLAHVCQAWRDAARACPRLWSTIEIDAALDTQLHLAYPAPLDIIFHVGQFKYSSHLCDLLGRLVCRSNCWAGLSLDWEYDSKIFSVLSGVKGQLASLHSLKLGNPGSDCWPSIFADIFSVAPRLRRVEASIPAEISPSQFLIPQGQLTHLRLSTCPSRALDILPLLADTLTHAALAVGDDEADAEYSSDSEDEFESESPAVIELPKLQWLSLDNDWGMGCLVVPRLDSLKITACIGNVHTILDRSQCQLKSLDFNGWAASEVLHSLEERLPTLVHLTVELPFLEDGKSLLSALTQSVADGVCPKLVSLVIKLSSFRTVRRSEGQKEDFEIICEAVESCWNIAKDARTLRSVHFPMGKCPPLIMDRFDRMRLEGLDVSEGSVIQSDEEFDR
ncbi:hypothetical protein R3P38DRAFT_3277462 [Favolaschia claudopus]|uniref:F-box domain-containing protein n=1 Tax=Favolaschia claudopus TaxID=2862362 RepID=A0AAW0AN25_9AGAR